MDKKYIFIACAMRCEAEPFIEKMEQVKIEKIMGFEFHFGKLKEKDIIVGISNIGMANISGIITVAVARFNIGLIINYGTSGGYGPDIHSGDIVVGSECMNNSSYITSNIPKGVDMESWEFVTFLDGEENRLVIYQTDKELLKVCKKIKVDKFKVIFGRVCGSDVWNREHEKIKLLHKKFYLLCEDMESPAVYQLSDRYKVPCIAIRGISNNEILGEPYDESVIGNLVDYIELFINGLKNI